MTGEPRRGASEKKTAATANDVATRVASHTKRPAERTEKKGNTAALRPFAMPNTVEGKKKKSAMNRVKKRRGKKKRNRTEKGSKEINNSRECVCESRLHSCQTVLSLLSCYCPRIYEKKKEDI